VIPLLAGKIIAEMLTGVADYGAAIYRQGYNEGLSLVKNLADGKISAADFEDQTTRQRCRETQKHKRYRIQKYKRS